MKDILIVGASKFSLELASYLQDIEPTAVIRRMSLPGEEIFPGLETEPFPDGKLSLAHRYVLGVPDVKTRRRLLDTHFSDHALELPNFIHPGAKVGKLTRMGRGNVIGPACYIGVNVALGSFNVVNYHCCIGNHNIIGDNNFFAPQFNSGNTVTVGSDCYFGLSVILIPDTEVNDNVTIQAGVTASEVLPAGAHCMSSARQKIVHLT